MTWKTSVSNQDIAQCFAMGPDFCHSVRIYVLTTILQGGCAPAVIEDEISPGVVQCLSDYMTRITLGSSPRIRAFQVAAASFPWGLQILVIEQEKGALVWVEARLDLKSVRNTSSLHQVSHLFSQPDCIRSDKALPHSPGAQQCQLRCRRATFA